MQRMISTIVMVIILLIIILPYTTDINLHLWPNDAQAQSGYRFSNSANVNISTSENLEPEKVKLNITIIYNEVTLEEAAEIDKEIKERYKEACEIKVKIDQIIKNDTWRSGRIVFQPDCRMGLFKPRRIFWKSQADSVKGDTLFFNGDKFLVK